MQQSEKINVTDEQAGQVGSASDVEQLLTFKLDDEVFAIEIARVREVLEYTQLTKVPRTPDFLRGVINLRGNVIPVVDLRRMFCMGSTEASVNACVIIVEVEMDGEEMILGVLADSVQEVLELPRAQIEKPPKFGARLKNEFLKGMGRRDDHLLMILSIDEVFSNSDMVFVKEAAKDAPAPVSDDSVARAGHEARA
jgi:purine-binding chemotaxis protein CheW